MASIQERITSTLASIHYDNIRFQDDDDRLLVLQLLEECRAEIRDLDVLCKQHKARYEQAEEDLNIYKRRKQSGNRPMGRTK